MQLLRQSTAGQVIKLGPQVKTADGTPQTGLTIANTDIKLLKNNATSSVNKTSGGATELETGDYYATLDATDTNTLGRLSVKTSMAATLVFSKDFMVVPANVYDSQILGTDLLQVDVTELVGNASAASNLRQSALGVVPFTVDTAGGFSPTTTQFETNLTETTTNHYKDRIVEWVTGALAGQISQVVTNTIQGGRVRFTVTTQTEANANADTGVLL